MKLGNKSILFWGFFIPQISFEFTLERNLKYFTPRQVETQLFFFSCEMNMSSIATKETKGQGKPHPLAFFMDVAHHSDVSGISSIGKGQLM